MKAITYKTLCTNEGLNFIKKTTTRVELKYNEYYALMVLGSGGNPHVVGVDRYTNEYLVGIERPNKLRGSYISKSFRRRDAMYRGVTIVVEVEDVSLYTVLS